MVKTICKRTYDTEIAVLVHKYTYSFYGDPSGYEEILFQTPEGLYFVYGRGGESSPYPEEYIQRIAKAKIANWIDTH